MNRRSFITGMAGILASGTAPAVIGSGVLMPVRTIWRPADKLSFAELPFQVRVGPYSDSEQELFELLQGLQWDMEQIAGMGSRRPRPKLILNSIK